MKKIILIITLLIFLVACAGEQSETTTTQQEVPAIQGMNSMDTMPCHRMANGETMGNCDDEGKST